MRPTISVVIGHQVFSFSFFTKCQSGDIKIYGGAPNFSIHPHIIQACLFFI